MLSHSDTLTYTYPETHNTQACGHVHTLTLRPSQPTRRHVKTQGVLINMHNGHTHRRTQTSLQTHVGVIWGAV